MSSRIGFLVLMVSTSLSLACGRPATSGVSTSGTSINNGVPPMPVNFSFDDFQAGTDYPTEMPLPGEWADKKILVIQQPDFRIRVPATATLTRPVAGIDYPTELAPNPLDLIRPVLVLGEEPLRLRLNVFSSDRVGGPLELTIPGQKPIAIRDLAAIDRAVAGVDFPVGSPMSIRVVVITKAGLRIVL